MRPIIILILATLFSSESFSQQIYVTDSIAYKYAGEASEIRAKSYLRQFGCVDEITDRTKVIRDGDFINIVTKLEKEGRYKVVNITRNSQTDLKTVQESDYIENYQTIYGYMEGSVYFEELDYYNPINSVESPYVTVYWIIRDFDDDKKFERLELHLINSKDIIQIFHCHIEE